MYLKIVSTPLFNLDLEKDEPFRGELTRDNILLFSGSRPLQAFLGAALYGPAPVLIKTPLSG